MNRTARFISGNNQSVYEFANDAVIRIYEPKTLTYDSDWYDHDTFFDVFCQKYSTRWISNQKSHGIHENAQATYAALCDTVWFACQHTDVVKTNQDSELLPTIRTLADNDSTPSITIINLMGQHEAFKWRYPAAWKFFNPEDYPDYKEHQRVYMSQYDNATRYNDHVVASIFDIYKDKEALVFYFPDHGLDLYETDPDYCGHVELLTLSRWRSWSTPSTILSTRAT